jgi:hypothetical protein
MAMTFTLPEVSLAEQIRSRIEDGAAVWEAVDLPDWLADAVGDATVETVFVSAHAGVAVLADGGRVVRRAPRG